MKNHNTLYAFSLPVLIIALCSWLEVAERPGEPAPAKPKPITYQLTSSQSSSVINCTAGTNFSETSCYATKIWAPLTVNFQQLVDSFPSQMCTLAIQFADTLKGKTSQSNPPYIYTKQYCYSSGVSDSLIKASIGSSSYNSTDTTTNINIEVDLIFQLSTETSLSGGLCVIIETMDPLSPANALKPVAQSLTLSVGENDFTPTLSTSVSVPRLNCTTCTTSN